MTGYDPQRRHQRPRPAPPGEAPVDALLAGVPVIEPEPTSDPQPAAAGSSSVRSSAPAAPVSPAAGSTGPNPRRFAVAVGVALLVVVLLVARRRAAAR